MLVILAAPSGTGKSTIARELFKRRSKLSFSVSHTTRPPRPGEADGVHYHFTDDATFEQMVEQDAFAEWAHVHKRRYGTSKSEVERLSDQGRDILFDVDVQGAEQLLSAYPEAVSIFIVPPSLEVLEARLRGRGTEDAEQVQTRLKAAQSELACATMFTYLIVNDDLSTAIEQVDGILAAEEHRRSGNPMLEAFVRRMAGDSTATTNHES